MDFFEAQDAARKRTSLLIGLFALAVLAMVAVIYVVAHVGLAVGVDGRPVTLGVDPVLLLWVALGVGVVIAFGMATRTASLRSGGPAVAELLGGRRVSPDTTDLEERKLLNVVEEMSIASGTPVPAVYVLDGEDGINAFAAGYTMQDAAVAVTRGALHTFTRDELQAVMAHEFSHILNGDMRLNIRLMGVLYGILLLAIIGRGIVYAGPRGGRRGGRDGGAGWIVFLGIALLLVGYIGVFFGKMIKAAVSRQREYLADSAAVQFTRNPDGLAGALKKIGAQAHGSRVRDHHAEELSHLFFANGLKSSMFGFLSTHPPLEERIRRLDPGWSGDFDAPPTPRVAEREEHVQAARKHGFGGLPLEGLAAAAALEQSRPSGVVTTVGMPTPEHLEYASRLMERFPAELMRALHDPVESRALLLALVLAPAEPVLDVQRAAVREYGGPDVANRVATLLPMVREQGADARLPLLDLALPALQGLTPDEADRLIGTLEQVVDADGEVHIFEFALIHSVRRRLRGGGERQVRSGRVRDFGPLRTEVETVLSALAWVGAAGDAELAGRAFEAGVRHLPGSVGSLTLRDPSEVDLPRVDRALTGLETASPAVQRHFLEACAETAAQDGRLDQAEAELLRAISESLDCPMPPVLATA
jgi:Zn-dependent protease with chaperone function